MNRINVSTSTSCMIAGGATLVIVPVDRPAELDGYCPTSIDDAGFMGIK